MEPKNVANQLLRNIENMVDPKAPVEQQLAQMRAQMAALSELPNIINQKLQSVNQKISQISMKESMKREVVQEQRYAEVLKHNDAQIQNLIHRGTQPNHSVEITELEPDEELRKKGIEIRVTKPSLTEEESMMIKRDQLKRSLNNELKTRQEIGNQSQKKGVSQMFAPRGKPEPAFGPGTVDRPMYLPSGRKFKVSTDYDDDQISETLTGQAEVIKGRVMGVNFKKFDKPPPGLEHLQYSEVFKAVHNMDQPPLKKVELLGPAIAESEIRERVRSLSPAVERR